MQYLDISFQRSWLLGVTMMLIEDARGVTGRAAIGQKRPVTDLLVFGSQKTTR
jgi:hypothetical protein